MSYIQKLPTELLLKVFDHVDTAAQIAQCRLVCRAWNRVAQPSLMISKILSITSEKKANQLYRYLLDNPQQAARVKNMIISLRQLGSRNNGFVKMISLAFTPTMESLTGVANNKKFFDALVETADKYDDVSFTRLKSIPHYAQKGYDSYNAALIKFKDTLEYIHLTSRNALRLAAANQLSGFGNLKKIDLDFNYMADPLELSTILRDCSQIEELGIYMATVNPVVPWNRRLPWNRDTVQQNQTMKTLRIHGDYSFSLLQYLIYKYPNVNRVIVDTIIQGKSHKETLDSQMPSNHIYQIVDMIHDKPFYSLKFRLRKGSTIKAIENYISS